MSGCAPAIVPFTGCLVRRWSADYLETVFKDGLKAMALFSYDKAACDLAERLGYGTDVRQMHIHHELSHTILAEASGLPFSPVLRAAAEGHRRVRGGSAEEGRVLAFQRYVKTGQVDERAAILGSLMALSDRLHAAAARLAVR